MGIESVRKPIWQGIASSIADTLLEVSGYLMVRTAQSHDAGATTLNVESTHRWTDAGRIFINGESYYYTSKTDTTLVGIGQDKPPIVGAGLVKAVGARVPVTLYSTDVTLGEASSPLTDMDKLRCAFFVETALDYDLDVLGRNYGIVRPRGISDTVYRQLLKVMIAQGASNIHSIEQVMTVLKGVGNFEVWEDDAFEAAKVFVGFTKTLSDEHHGRAYMPGFELASVTSTTGQPYAFTLSETPTIVYGAYAEADTKRQGQNFAEMQVPGTVNSAPLGLGSDTFSYVGPATFTVDDLGKGIRFATVGASPPAYHNECWPIQEVLGTQSLRLGSDVFKTGLADAGSPLKFKVGSAFFEKWMVGHGIDISVSGQYGNIGKFTISEFVSAYAVNVTGPAGFAGFWSDELMSWRLVPIFPADQGRTILLNRATINGTSVTLTNVPVGNPAGTKLLVDYTTVPTAELMQDFLIDGNSSYAFYLFDDNETLKTVLDLITAAGVKPVLVEET